MPKWEQASCKKYAGKIAAGEHVIHTQLSQIAGVKNAFEKITAISEKGELEVLHTSKHAGSLASLAEIKMQDKILQMVMQDKLKNCLDQT